MPSFVNINAIPAAQKHFVRALTVPLPQNQVLLKPSPHQHFLELPQSKIPPNVRIQNYIVNERKLWKGMTMDEKKGPVNRNYQGRIQRDGWRGWSRKWGGIKWAVRER